MSPFLIRLVLLGILLGSVFVIGRAIYRDGFESGRTYEFKLMNDINRSFVHSPVIPGDWACTLAETTACDHEIVLEMRCRP